MRTRGKTLGTATLIWALVGLSPAVDAGELALCGGQVATIVGTPDNEQLVGTSGRDVISGGESGDRINGLGGRDLICGGRGSDVLDGGGESDRIIGGLGHDRFFEAAAGSDVMRGGRGNDDIEDQDGNGYGVPDKPVPPKQFQDEIKGGSGIDEIRSVFGTDEIDAGEGVDECMADRRSTVTSCEADRNYISWWNTRKLQDLECFREPADLIGTPEDDYFESGTDYPVVMGLGGDDYVNAEDVRGIDAICGGTGDDRLGGGSSPTWMSGGPGDDFLAPGFGDDVSFGGAGADMIDDFSKFHGGGTDMWLMGDGDDQVRIDSGEDVVFGGIGADDIFDRSCFSNSLHGNVGDDVISAHDADDDGYSCVGRPDNVYGDEGTDVANVTPNDNVYGAETVNVSTPPPD